MCKHILCQRKCINADWHRWWWWCIYYHMSQGFGKIFGTSQAKLLDTWSASKIPEDWRSIIQKDGSNGKYINHSWHFPRLVLVSSTGCGRLYMEEKPLLSVTFRTDALAKKPRPLSWRNAGVLGHVTRMWSFESCPKKKQQVEKEFWTLWSTFWVTHHSSQERSGVFSCVFWVTDSPTAPFHLWSLWWTARPPILLDILHQLTWCNLQSNCCNRMLIRLLNKLIEQSLSIKHLVVLLTC